MSSDNGSIVRIGADRFDEAVDVLKDAFRDYPVMRYVLKDGVDYEVGLTAKVGYLTYSRISREWPVLAVEQAGRIQAVANINPPRTIPKPPELEQRYREMCDQIGPAALARFDAFAEACDAHEPEAPHYYLGMIGVRPGCQGRGFGRLLLDELHRMSEADPESGGVALTTETPGNLKLYEHFGYELLGQAQVEELRTWSLFRPDGAGR